MNIKGMRILVSLAKVFVLSAMVFIFCGKAQAIEESDILFYAPFDGVAKPEISQGSSEVNVTGKESYENGIKGQALLSGEKSVEYCYYKVEGNFIANQGSIEMWIKSIDWESVEDKHHIFFETAAFNGARMVLSKQAGSNSDKISFHIWTSESNVYGVDSKSPLEKGKWYHVVGAWDNGEVAIYVDGELREKLTGSEYIMPQQVGPYFLVGDRPWGTVREGGRSTLIDELYIYKRSLTPVEIRSAYRKVMKQQQSEQKYEPPVVTVCAAVVPPNIDGQISPGEWDKTTMITGFIDRTSKNLSKKQSKLCITYDNERIYFAFVSPVLADLKLITNATARDSETWLDDAIEIYLAPKDTDKEIPDYFDFCGNSAGIFADVKVENGKIWEGFSWNGNWDYKSKVVETVDEYGAWYKNWIAELSIPFKEFGVSRPKDGEIWRANFCRDWNGQVELTPWAYTTNLHDTQTFGYLIFREKGPVIRIGSIDVKGSEINLKAEVINLLKTEPINTVGNFAVFSPTGKDMEDMKEIKVSSASKEVFNFKHKVKGQENTFIFNIIDADKTQAEPYFKANYPFSQPESLSVKLITIGSRGLMKVSLDAVGLPESTKGIVANVEIISSGTDKVVVNNIVDKWETDGTGTAELKIANLPSGNYNIRVRLMDGERIIAEKNLQFVKPSEEWRGTKVGETDKVLPPWTPMEVKKDGSKIIVYCWGREYHFEPGNIISQIITAGKSILKKPVYFDVGGITWKSKKIDIISQTPAKIILSQTFESSKLNLELRTNIEFDGLIYYELVVKPVDGVAIENLAMIIPLNVQNAKYITRNPTTGVQDAMGPTGSEDGWQWNYALPYYMWIGDEDRGLTWFTEKKWELAKSSHGVSLFKDGETMVWRFNLIDASKTIKEPLKFAFGLHATPIKPLPSDWRTYGSEREGSKNSLVMPHPPSPLKYWAYPEAVDPVVYKKYIADFHAQGVKVNPYIHVILLSMDAPECQYYGTEWENGKTWAPGQEADFSGAQGMCPSVKDFRDFMVYKCEKMVREYDLDGLYYDHAFPFICSNTYHHENGEVVMPILAQRDLYKRLYTVVKSLRKPGYLIGHTMQGECTPLMSFLDVCVGGEALMDDVVEKEGDYIKILSKEIPFDRFKAFYMGRQFGVVPIFLSVLWRIKDNTGKITATQEMEDTMTTMVLLHDVTGLWGWPIHKTQVLSILDNDFGISADDTEFLPYWSNEKYAKVSFKPSKDKELPTQNPPALVSIYKRNGKSLFIIGNITDRDGTVDLSIDFAGLGLEREKVSLIDGFTQQPIKSEGIDVKHKNFRIIIAKGIE